MEEKEEAVIGRELQNLHKNGKKRRSLEKAAAPAARENNSVSVRQSAGLLVFCCVHMLAARRRSRVFLIYENFMRKMVTGKRHTRRMMEVMKEEEPAAVLWRWNNVQVAGEDLPGAFVDSGPPNSQTPRLTTNSNHRFTCLSPEDVTRSLTCTTFRFSGRPQY